MPFRRLILVELRKSLDTRAGRWYAYSLTALMLVVALLQAFVFNTGTQDFHQFLAMSGYVLNYFLPILPILLVTQEWSQRTTLVTFALEPRRSRVIWAKLAAVLLLSVCAMAVAALIGVLGTILAESVRGADVSWHVGWAGLLGFTVQATLGVIIGFALGTLFLNTPLAIVGYFIYALMIPFILALLLNIWPFAQRVVPWIVLQIAMAPIYAADHLSGKDWARVVVSVALWAVLPLVLGLARIMRAEVK